MSTGKGTLSKTKELAFHQLSGDRSTVHFDKGFVSQVGFLMNPPGDQIFADTTLSLDQDGHSGIGNLKNGVMEKFEGWVNFRGRMLYEYIYPLRDDAGNYLGVVEELHDAAEKAEYLKTKGDWKDIHISGLGEKSPRTPSE